MRHCRCPRSAILLANVALVYLVTSALYLVRTQSLGTPFADSLTAEQRDLKRTAAHTRGSIFKSSAAVAALAIWAIGPLRAA